MQCVRFLCKIALLLMLGVLGNFKAAYAIEVSRDFALSLEIAAHTGAIYALAFSPDGSVLASSGEDESVALWNTDTWKLFRRIEGSSGSVRDLSFSPDGSLLAAGSDDGTVRLWDTQTWANPKVIPAHVKDVRAVAFSKDGKWLVTAGRDQKAQPPGRLGRVRGLLSIDRMDDTAKLWSVADLTLKQMLLKSGSRVVALEFSPTGHLLASGAENGHINLFNTKDWRITKQLDYEPGSLKALAFFEGGTRLISGGHRRGSTVWSAPDWEEIVSFGSPASPIQAIDYNVLENQLVVGGRDRVPTFLKSNGTEITEIEQKKLKSDKPIGAISLSSDGSTLAFGSNDGMISIAQAALPIPAIFSLVTSLVPRPIPVPMVTVAPIVSIPLPLVRATFEQTSNKSFLGGILTFVIGLFIVIWLASTFGNLIEEPQHPENQGYVYLLKSGDYYKIGKSKDYNKRIKAIKLQLPFEVEKVHVVKTGNMNQLEKHWHQRFKSKRANGEWFRLSNEDIKEFKRQ